MKKWWIAGVALASSISAVGASFWNASARGQEAKLGIHVICPFLELGENGHSDCGDGTEKCCDYYAYEHEPDCYNAIPRSYEAACGKFGYCVEPDIAVNCANLGGNGGAALQGCGCGVTGSSETTDTTKKAEETNPYRIPFMNQNLPVDPANFSLNVGKPFEELGEPFVVQYAVDSNTSKYALICLYRCNYGAGKTARTTVVGVGFECSPNGAAPLILGQVRKVETVRAKEKQRLTRERNDVVELQLGITRLLVKVKSAKEWLPNS